MKKLLKSALLPLALFAAAACSNGTDGDPVDPPVDPAAPQITLRQCPDEWKAGETVDIIAGVTVASGTVSSVTLYYNDGSSKNATMSATSAASEYSASFTVPATAGKTVAYYVEAVSSGNKTSKSETVTLTTVEESVTDDTAKNLRLSEIGTSGDYKFIEIYNPTGLLVSLDGVSLWKNGELLTSFAASQTLGAKAYGVFRAKGTLFTIPSTAQDLGTTEIGLSGSKSLSVELHYKDAVIDAFANTVNPGVSQMTIEDWDGMPETAEGTTFIRPKGSAYGWYAAPATATATPGKENGSSGTRLKHQLFKDDAVACPPYIAGITINPADPTSGLTPTKNVIRFSVYYDAHSSVPTVISSTGSPSNVGGTLWKITLALSGSSTGTDAAITLTATNATGPHIEKITVLVFADATAFGSCTDIRLNEIRTSDKDGIELYNTSSKPVVIGGMRIRKNKDSIFIIPGYMVMKAGGYAVLGCNGNDYTTTSGAYLNMGKIETGLSGSKSLLIELRKPKIEGDLTNSTNIDSFVNISTSEASPNKDSSWDVDNFVEKNIPEVVGRKPDATGAWYIFSKHSMGASNSASTTTGNAFIQTYHQDSSGD